MTKQAKFAMFEILFLSKLQTEIFYLLLSLSINELFYIAFRMGPVAVRGGKLTGYERTGTHEFHVQNPRRHPPDHRKS